MSDGHGESGGFKVTDRRRFAGDGEPAEASSDEVSGRGSSDGPATRAPVTFLTFIMGLSTQALMHLGEIADPVTGESGRDLDAASHLIDILALLQTKTSGNLSSDEAGLIEAVLYDLRMRYVAVRTGAGSDPGKETS